MNIEKLYMRLALFVLLLVASAHYGLRAQAVFTWNGSVNNDWFNPANWTFVGLDADGIPDSNDQVILNGNVNCVLTANAACASLTINVTYTGTFNIGTHTLEVHGSWTHQPPSNNFQPSTGTVIFRGGGIATISFLTTTSGFANYFYDLVIAKTTGSTLTVGAAFDDTRPLASNQLIMESGNLRAEGSGLLPVANLRIRNGDSGFEAPLGRLLTAVGNAVVESGNFSLLSNGRLVVQGNYTQNGGFIIGANETAAGAARLRFANVLPSAPAVSVVSGTAVNIRASVGIQKEVRWTVGVTIGEPTNQKNLLVGNGTLDIQTITPHTINGSVIYDNASGIIQASASPTVFNILQNWDSSQSTAANPLVRPNGDSQIIFIGNTNSTVRVSANTVFDFVLVNKAGPDRLLEHIGNQTLRINRDLRILSGTLLANNVTDATNTINIVASVNHALNRNNSNGGPINVDTDLIQPLARGNNTGETVTYPAPDIWVAEDVVIENGASLDLGTNEPGNIEANRTNLITIALYIGKNLDDKNNNLPSNAQSMPGNYPANPAPRRGLYLGLSTTRPMGVRVSCTAPNAVNFQAGLEPRENYQIPTIVFFGQSPGAIFGNVPQLPDLCNNLNRGQGISLPNVYIVKTSTSADPNATSINMANNVRIHGNLIILRGTFNVNGFTLLYGDFAAKGLEGNTSLSDANLHQLHLSRDDKIDVYGVLLLPAGSRVLMNTAGEERGTFIRVRKGGFLRLVGTAASPVTLTREGSPGQYYRVAVYNGGAIEAVHAEISFMSAISDVRYSWTDARNRLLDNNITISPNYDLPSWEFEGGPGSGHGWQESRGGLKVMMGAIINPVGTTSADPQWGTIPHNFSRCSFGSGGLDAASLTINSGQALNIYSSNFSQNSANNSRNIVANSRYYFGPANGDVRGEVVGFGNLQMNVIRVISSSGAIGGTLGEQYDGGLNDNNQTPFFDQIIWENYTRIYWVGSYSAPPLGFRNANGQGPRSEYPFLPASFPVNINEQHTGSNTEWTNPKNWSLRNDEYYNPFQIYPGQTNLPAGLPKKDRTDTWVGNDPQGLIPPDTLKMFDVMITRTAPSNPTLNVDVEVYGMVVVNAGLLRDGTRIYDARDTGTGLPGIYGPAMQREDINPSINRGRDNVGVQKVLTVPAGRMMTIGGDLQVRANGQINIGANAEVRIAANLLALDNLAAHNVGIVPPATSTTACADDKNTHVTTGTLLTMPNIVMDPTATFVFNGIGEQQLQVRRNEVQNIRIDKPTGVLRVQGLTLSERARLQILGNLTINSGEFRMLSITPLLVNGNVTIGQNGSFTFNESPVTVRGNWINNGGRVNPGTGRINFHPNTPSKRIIKTSGEPLPAVYIGFFDDLTVQGCYHKDRNPDLYPAGHPIRFNPINTMVEYEVEDGLLALGHTTVMANRMLSTKPNTTVQLQLSGVRVENGGVLDLNPGGELLMNTTSSYPFFVRKNVYNPVEADNPTRTLLIEDGGRLEAIGVADQYVKISRQGTSGHYRFLVEGSVSARYFLFEFMDERGVDLSGTLSTDGAGVSGSGIVGSSNVNISRGENIDPALGIGSFSDGIFTNGHLVANAVYLNLPVDYISSDIFRTNFALIIPNGYNVRRSPTSCVRPPNSRQPVVFRLASGPFRGEDFDHDFEANSCFGGQGNIHWIENIKRWDGRTNAGVPTTNNLWSNPQNWEGDVLPGPTDDVVIDYASPNRDPNYQNGNRPYIVEVDAGTVQVASLRINPSNDPTPPVNPITLRLTGGSLQLSSDLTVLQNATVDVQNPASLITVGGSWTNQGTFIHGNGTVRFDGGSGTRIINSGQNHAPNTYGVMNNPFYNVEFRSGISELNSTLFVENDLTIFANATLDASIANNRIDIQGNWLNNGVFVPRQGEVVFSGNKPQTLTKSGTPSFETFWIMIMAKGSLTGSVFPPSNTNLTLNSRLLIGPITGSVLGGELYLMNGKVITESGKEIIISEKAQWRRDVASPELSAFVEGPAGRVFSSNTSYLRLSYPIGKNNYTGTISDGVALNLYLDRQVPTTFSAEQFNDDPEDWNPNNVRAIYPSSAGINMISRDTYWRLQNIEFPNTPDAAADFVEMSIDIPFRGMQEISHFPLTINNVTYTGSIGDYLNLVQNVSILQDFDPSYDGTRFRGIPSAALDRQVKRGHYPDEGTHWNNLGGTPSTLDNPNTQVRSGVMRTLGNGQVTFGWFFTPLPVEIVNVEARLVEGRVQLRWLTANETNNAGFYVERSRDAQTIEQLGWVEAKASNLSINTYEYWDHYPPVGTVYYRLRQRDKDGGETISKWVSVTVRQPNQYTIGKVSLYPNPSEGGSTFFLELPYGVELYEWQLANMKGDLIDRQVLSAPVTTTTLQVRIRQPLPAGVYMVRVLTQNGWQFLRWVVM